MDFAARFGGEEFAIVMLGITLSEAREISERVRRDIEHCEIVCDGQIIRTSVSIGVVALSGDETAHDFLAAGDAAMVAAKKYGRNCVALRDVSGQIGPASQRSGGA
jgi:diguanylate cyclase (GGDEF)-like protein